MALGMEIGLSPGDFVLDGEPAPSQKERHSAPTQFSAHVYCGQTGGWIKMPLGTEATIGPGDVGSDGVPPPPKRESWVLRTPLFGEGGPHLTQCCLDRGLPAYQMAF